MRLVGLALTCVIVAACGASPVATTVTTSGTTPRATPLALITDRIDVPNLLAATTCSGGPLGAEGTHEIWTLHCRDTGDSAEDLASGFRDELSRLGATLLDEGAITSHNPGNDGDSLASMRFDLEDVVVVVRILLLPAGSESAVVVTIDQSQAEPTEQTAP